MGSAYLIEYLLKAYDESTDEEKSNIDAILRGVTINEDNDEESFWDFGYCADSM